MKEIKPGKGWRLLKPTERVDWCDETWIEEKQYWKPTAWAGVLAYALNPVRRRDEPK